MRDRRLSWPVRTYLIRRRWFAISLVLHVSLIVLVVRWSQARFERIVVTTAMIANAQPVSLALPDAEQYSPRLVPKNAQSLLHLIKSHNRRLRPKLHVTAQTESLANLGPILRPSSALLLFPGTHEIHVALPELTPKPRIRGYLFPNGYEGDVIVEVMIDRKGKVVRTRILQTMGAANDLDTVVLAAVRHWRFKPASFDGVPVASLQDVYFHYPDAFAR
ncbi:MAG TPA: energy transducer TonB [Terriglobales bacterium]|nr:energy transducer TonB [Terriglobales bacterium]